MPITKEDDEALKEVQEFAEKRAADVKQLDVLAPSIADALIKAGELDAGNREQAIKNIIDNPVKVAMALRDVSNRLVAVREGTPPASLGAGVINPSSGT